MIGMMLVLATQIAAPPPPPARSTATAPPAATPSTLSSTALARGTEIARMLNSEAITLRQIDMALDRDLPAQLAADANFQALEKTYPGISRSTITAMRPVIIEYTKLRVPILWARMGAIYAGSMTERELDETLAFYGSPTGTWLIEQVVAGSDFSKLLKETLADPDRKMTAADLPGMTNAKSLANISKTMTPARSAEITRFAASAAGRKVKGAQASLARVVVDWSNESDPQLEKAMETAVGGAIDRFIAKSTGAERGSGPKERGPAT